MQLAVQNQFVVQLKVPTIPKVELLKVFILLLKRKIMLSKVGGIVIERAILTGFCHLQYNI